MSGRNKIGKNLCFALWFMAVNKVSIWTSDKGRSYGVSKIIEHKNLGTRLTQKEIDRAEKLGLIKMDEDSFYGAEKASDSRLFYDLTEVGREVSKVKTETAIAELKSRYQNFYFVSGQINRKY